MQVLSKNGVQKGEIQTQQAGDLLWWAGEPTGKGTGQAQEIFPGQLMSRIYMEFIPTDDQNLFLDFRIGKGYLFFDAMFLCHSGFKVVFPETVK